MKFATIAALISVVSAGHEAPATNTGGRNSPSTASDPGNNGYNGNKVNRTETNGYDKQVDL